MADCQVPWGDGQLSLSLPEHWTLVQEAQPAVKPAPADWADRLAVALNRPAGSPPLCEILAGLPAAARIVILLEDITRHSPLEEILPIILRELGHARIRDSQVELVFATGMHRVMNEQEARSKIGALADRFAWRSHDAADAEAHVSVGRVPFAGRPGELDVQIDRGVMAADLRIVVASVSPHLQAGFGGGAKMFVPGCSAMDTIAQVHLQGLPRRSRPMVGTTPATNPMRRMIDAAAALIDRAGGATFAVQYLLDAQDKPSAVVAGDLAAGHTMLAKLCATATGVVVERPCDILIANAAPRDFDLWQSFKCIMNTRWAVRRNGIIIVLARCPGGRVMPAPPWPLSPTWTRRVIRWLTPEAVTSLANRLAKNINPEAQFFIKMATETIARNPLLVYAPQLVQRGEGFPGLHLFGQLDGLFAAADKMLPAGSRRVIVFPFGGASYPILTGGSGRPAE